MNLFAAADLEWKVIYVGSAEDTRYDQVHYDLDEMQLMDQHRMFLGGPKTAR